MKQSLILLLCTAAFTGSLTAQNLISNGDFAKVDARGNPSGWVIQKFDFAPKIAKFDTAGLGADNAFSVSHGKGNPANSGIGELVQQGLLIIQNTRYELRVDVAVGGNFNNGPGKFEVFLDGVSVASVDFTKSRGSKPGGVTFRERLCVQFQATKTNVKADLKIAVSRNFGALPGRTPTAYVDNVFLARANGPQVCVRGDRLVGTSVQVDLIGRPSTAVAFYFAVGALANPVAIPGWNGKLELQPPLLLLLAGKTDASGMISFKQTLPTAAAKFYVQGGQAGQVSAVDLGYSQALNSY